VIQALQDQGYDATGVSTDDEALAQASEGRFDALVIGGGVEPASREVISAAFRAAWPEIKVIHAHPDTLSWQLAHALGTDDLDGV
jgi:DNA-binding response OmpR family regulator